MALPPNMVAPGLDLDDTAGLPDVEIPVDEPMQFPGGAEVIDDGQGGAIIQALSEAGQLPTQEELIPFDANLADFLDDGTLGELSSDLRALYEEDLDSRSEWEETYVKGLDLLGLKTEERTTPFEGASGITHPMVRRIKSYCLLVVRFARVCLEPRRLSVSSRLRVLRTL